ncbi:MAG: ribonuclease P protein component [Bacteroidales bacterium]|nr:ribonuclease P protein component [Candidatus Physcousia equi]
MRLKNYRFRKSERLCSKKAIEALFEGGHPSVSVYPVRAVFMLRDAATPQSPAQDGAEGMHQVLISVSKRHFKHAVDRNRVKRQLREAYRLNRHLLVDGLPEATSLSMAFIWLSDDLFPSPVVQNKMQKLLLRIRESCRS